jgi:hypothetical protein
MKVVRTIKAKIVETIQVEEPDELNRRPVAFSWLKPDNSRQEGFFKSLCFILEG